MRADAGEAPIELANSGSQGLVADDWPGMKQGLEGDAGFANYGSMHGRTI
jgi:hypothetical protein